MNVFNTIDRDLPVNPKIRSLLTLILSPMLSLNDPKWGFIKSLSIQLTNTCRPLDADYSYSWLETLLFRMGGITGLKLVGFTWNSLLIDIVERLARRVQQIHLEILLIHDQDQIDWTSRFLDFFSQAKSAECLSLISSSDCMDPQILQRLLDLKLWIRLSIKWKTGMESGGFQLLLARLISWINYNHYLEYCKLNILLPYMMENISIPIKSLSKDGIYFVDTFVSPDSKMFTILIMKKEIINTRVRRSICVSSTETLIANDLGWTDKSGSGIFIVN